MDNRTVKTCAAVFATLVGVGVVLIIVSIFLSVIKVSIQLPIPGFGGSFSESLNLFDSGWDELGVSPVFMIVSYFVLLAGLIAMFVDTMIRQTSKKKVPALNYIALSVSFVGFLLLIISSVTTKVNVANRIEQQMLEVAKQSPDYSQLGYTDESFLFLVRMMLHYNLDVGVIMAIVGGAVAVIGSVLLVIPAFDTTKTPPSFIAPNHTAATSGLASVRPFSIDPNTFNNFDNDGHI